MKTSEYTATLLKADEGKWLTQSADVELMDRSFYSQLALAKSAKPSDYKEVDDEYKKSIEEQQNAVKEEERQKRIAAEKLEREVGRASENNGREVPTE